MALLRPHYGMRSLLGVLDSICMFRQPPKSCALALLMRQSRHSESELVLVNAASVLKTPNVLTGWLLQMEEAISNALQLKDSIIAEWHPYQNS